MIRPADGPLLRIRDLCKHFPVGKRGLLRHDPAVLKAVDRVNLDVMPGETLGVVGESGSGKTTLVRCVLRALDPTAGRVLLRQPGGGVVDLAALGERALRPLRRQMQMIFQDPFSSLNPRMTVGDIVGEPLLVHRMGRRPERNRRVAEMLERVGLEAAHMQRYPHAFSGGQRQRIGIARALIMRPSLVVADEAVSALDVSVQGQVLDLLSDLQRELGLTYIFVSHDLSVIKQVCDRVAVMYKGRVVELATSRRLFAEPRHAYTRVLLSAIPQPDPDRRLEPMAVEDLTPEELEPLPDAGAVATEGGEGALA